MPKMRTRYIFLVVGVQIFRRPILAILFGAGLVASTCGLAAQEWLTPAKKWQKTIWMSDSSPAIGRDGTIYLGAVNGRFYAVSSNGVVKWAFKTGYEIRSSPAIAEGGTVYFGCRNRKLYAVSEEGRKKWEFLTGGWVDASPAIGTDGTVYFGSWDKTFYALHSNGTVRWKFSTRGEIESSAAVGNDGTLYFGSHDGKLYALASDGQKRWEFATGAPILSSPALNGEGMIYFTSVNGFLYAVNENGELRWRLHTGGITESSPTIGAEGTIYLGVNKSLWKVTPEGKRVSEHRMENFVASTPLVAEGDLVYIVSHYGDLRAFGPGQDRFFFYLFIYGHASPALGADGTVYVPGKYHDLFALETTHPLAQSPWPKFRGDLRNSGRVNGGTP
jgi:outer membrane protein assembly factor BamB